MLSFCCCGHVTSSPGLRSSFSSTPSLLPPFTVWPEVTRPLPLTPTSPVLPGVPVRGCRHWLSFISRHCVGLLIIQRYLDCEMAGSIRKKQFWAYWDIGKKKVNFPIWGHFTGPVCPADNEEKCVRWGPMSYVCTRVYTCGDIPSDCSVFMHLMSGLVPCSSTLP